MGAKPTEQLVGIQYLRGIAAVMVAVHHTLEESYGATNMTGRAPDWFTTLGAAGVDIFFVISGLVMLLSSFGTEGAVRPLTFLRKRFLRIFPLYWLCLLGLFLCWLAGFYQSLEPDPRFMLRNAMLWPGERLALGVSWTLSYELYFYGIFAVMLFARSRAIAVAGTLAVLCAGIVIAPLLAPSEPVRRMGDLIVLEFTLGFSVAYGLAAFRQLRGLAWVALPGFAMIAASTILSPIATTNELPMPERLLGWGLGGALVVLGFAALREAPTPFHRPLKLIGDASYAIYLTHPFLMLGYAFALKHVAVLRESPQPLIAAGVVGACVLAGIAVHLMVEKPMLRPVRKVEAQPADPASARTIGVST